MSETVRQQRLPLRAVSDADELEVRAGPADVGSGERRKPFFSFYGRAEAPSGVPPGAWVNALGSTEKIDAFYLFTTYGRLAAESASRGMAALQHYHGSWYPAFSDLVEAYLGQLLPSGLSRSPGLLPAVSGVALGEARDEVRLENERLRTELIEKRREVLLLRQALAKSDQRQGRLVDLTCDLTASNKLALEALAAQRGGRMCLSEGLTGVVTRVVGEEIEITYDSSEGTLRQIYRTAQFIPQKAPGEGDSVRVFAFIAIEPRPEVKEPAPAEETAAGDEDFRTWAESRPLIVD
jgi:hypothetical protein